MKRYVFYGIIWSLFILTWCSKVPAKIADSLPQICINNSCFNIEIADTQAKQEYGLMNRTSMPEQSGMLFVFDKEGEYTFWMKDTLIPLDMIRIDSGLNIVGIKEAAPCLIETNQCPTYNPGKPASYVLEINKWISQKLGFEAWQKVEIKK